MKRPPVKFSLATLLLLVTAAAIAMGFVVKKVKQVKQQQRAVAMVAERGGIVHFRHQYDEKNNFDPKKDLTAPTWLRRALGDEYFREIQVIDMSYGSGGLKNPISKIGDGDLECFESLSDIEQLELSRNKNVTDKGLVHLRSLDGLKVLYLYKTSVEGLGLAHLARLPNIDSLTLGLSPVNDSGMTHVGEMMNLRFLNLEGTKVTDSGIERLTRLKHLETLLLANTEVSDDSIEHLKKLERLERLDLTFTRITAQVAAQLGAAIPNCRVSVAYGLGMEPESPFLWESDVRPTRETLLVKLEELNAFPEPANPGPEQAIEGLMLMDSLISDETLIHILGELPDLKRLNLRRCLVGDKLLAYLASQPNYREQFEFLSISYSRITDAGMQDLARLENLREVDLTETKITDAGFEELKTMPKLGHVQADRTRASLEGMIRLQQAMPNASISY